MTFQDPNRHRWCVVPHIVTSSIALCDVLVMFLLPGTPAVVQLACSLAERRLRHAVGYFDLANSLGAKATHQNARVRGNSRALTGPLRRIGLVRSLVIHRAELVGKRQVKTCHKDSNIRSKMIQFERQEFSHFRKFFPPCGRELASER